MKYGYARLSTGDQDSASQAAALKRAGCQKVFSDKLSGVAAKRSALVRCLKTLQNGDTLIVWKLDRLGRSLSDLISILEDLRTRGIRFCSLTEAVDTGTPEGGAMWQTVRLLARFERSLNNQRTRAGIHSAQRRGVKFGRRPKLTPQQIARARARINRGEAAGSVASRFRVSRATMYRALAT
jgi:DNA invertase Pin-like site-specific DNA recombinase